MTKPRKQSKSAVDANEQPRAWQRMLSGRRLDLLDPSPLDIEIEDIAHGLARVARWNGQTLGKHAFSVAQHCVLVEEIFSALNKPRSKRQRLMALLHDAPEYVIGDLISPFKSALGLDYKDSRIGCSGPFTFASACRRKHRLTFTQQSRRLTVLQPTTRPPDSPVSPRRKANATSAVLPACPWPSSNA